MAGKEILIMIDNKNKTVDATVIIDLKCVFFNMSYSPWNDRPPKPITIIDYIAI